MSQWRICFLLSMLFGHALMPYIEKIRHLIYNVSMLGCTGVVFISGKVSHGSRYGKRQDAEQHPLSEFPVRGDDGFYGINFLILH